MKYLRDEPAVQTANRKPLAPNPLGASWELHVGNLRVYYDVNEAEEVVEVLGFGRKVGERVRIGSRFVDMREASQTK